MKVDENEMFREVTARICGELDFQIALRNADTYLKTIFPHKYIINLVATDDFESLEFLASTISYFPQDNPIKIKLTNQSQKFLSQGLFASNSIFDNVAINNQGAFEPLYQDAAEAIRGIVPDAPKFVNQESVMVLKLNASGSTAGYLALIADGFDRYTNEHARLLSRLAEPFAIAMVNFLRYRQIVNLKNDLDDNQKILQQDLLRKSGDTVVGAEGGLQRVMELARMVAHMDNPVLLLGETGSGKEVVANAIHQMSNRVKGPIISVNCGAITDTLVDSELFGHEKGAFTGADSRKRGFFERADGGTIFLDEIGELSPSSQVKLLRVIQDMTFNRVGGTHPVKVDVRIIAATHRDLPAMVEEGVFRQDLWFRLTVFPVNIPPLRERKEDIPGLVDYLVERKSREMNLVPKPKLAPGSIEVLLDYDWPGNVRELQNTVERALILSCGEPLWFEILGTARTLKSESPVSDQGKNLEELNDDSDTIPLLDETIKTAIERALARTKGRIEGNFGAAKLLGVNPSTLKSKIRKLGIKRIPNS